MFGLETVLVVLHLPIVDHLRRTRDGGLTGSVVFSACRIDLHRMAKDVVSMNQERRIANAQSADGRWRKSTAAVAAANDDDRSGKCLRLSAARIRGVHT